MLAVTVRRFSLAISALALVLTATDARAQSHPELRHDATLGLLVIGTSLTAHGISEFALKTALGPTHCSWCDRDDSGDTLNALDRETRRALKWRDTATADTLSYVTALLAPASAIALNAIAARTEGESWTTVGVDALIVGEVVAVSLATNQLVKFLVGRERPFVHARAPDERAALAHNDDNLSFYSGHTKLAFSSAAAAGMVASMRHYDLAPVVWASGATLGVSTAVLRIGADKHYLTDVTVGAFLGALYGTILPYVFHRPTRDAVAPSAPAPTTPTRFATSIAIAF